MFPDMVKDYLFNELREKYKIADRSVVNKVCTLFVTFFNGRIIVSFQFCKKIPYESDWFMILVHTGSIVWDNLKINLVLHVSIEEAMLCIVFMITSISSSVMVWKLDRILQFQVGLL